MKAIDRLYKYLDYKGIKPTTFEKSIGFSNGYISTMKKRGADMGESILNKITEYCRDLNPEWLLTGEGGMTRISMPEVYPDEMVQTPPGDIVSKFLDEMKGLNETIANQAKTIGALEVENEYLKKVISSVGEGGAGDVGCAGVG